MKIIYTAGVWDLLHRGHLNVFKASRAMGDRLIVGVVADASYKGVEPAWTLAQRVQYVMACPYVDLAVVQPGTDPTPALVRLDSVGACPAVMTHGDDWEVLREGQETLEALGIEWKLIPYTDGISSTELRDGIPELQEA